MTYLGSCEDMTVNHHGVALIYFIAGLIGGSFGFAMSMLIRSELATSGATSVGPLLYHSLVSFHGLFMIFLFVMPIVFGALGNLLFPLACGLNDMMFPRMNACGAWLMVLSLFLFGFAFLIDGGVTCGWTLYTPLSLTEDFSMDMLILAIHCNGLSSMLGAANFIGSYRENISTFATSLIVTSYLLMLAVPVLAATITMMLIDRHLTTGLLEDPTLYQHLFWFFGHPEVYILIMPAFGLVSDILTREGQTELYGRQSMIFSLYCIGAVGMVVWGHHMYMAGINDLMKSYFGVATSIIAIPTGLKIYNWIMTILNSTRSTSATWFIYAFLVHFTIGGITGLILSNPWVDAVYHDTQFVVGHFHYVLSLGLVYIIFATIYSYWHQFTGREYCPIFSKLHLATLVVSSNLVFLPTHVLGLFGMPRRIYGYEFHYMGLAWLQTLGSFGLIISLAFFMLAI